MLSKKMDMAFLFNLLLKSGEKVQIYLRIFLVSKNLYEFRHFPLIPLNFQLFNFMKSFLKKRKLKISKLCASNTCEQIALPLFNEVLEVVVSRALFTESFDVPVKVDNYLNIIGVHFSVIIAVKDFVEVVGYFYAPEVVGV